MTEHLSFSQLIEQAKQQALETQHISPQLEEDVLALATVLEKDQFRDEFHQVFESYLAELTRSSQGEDDSQTPEEVRATFLTSALVVAVGMRADMYGSDTAEVFEKYIAALQDHIYAQYFIDAVTEQLNNANPFWGVILSSLSS